MMSWLEVRESEYYSTRWINAGQEKEQQQEQQEEWLMERAVVFVVVVVPPSAAAAGRALLMTTICALNNEAVPLNGRRNMLHARKGIRHATIDFYTNPVRRPPASLPHHSETGTESEVGSDRREARRRSPAKRTARPENGGFSPRDCC